MLSDADAINDINPFVSRDFSLPGGVGQTGDFADFADTRQEIGIQDPTKSVFCEYALCKESNEKCPLSRPFHPKRNIDHGFVTKHFNKNLMRIGVANKPTFSLVGWIIFLILLFTILYYVRR